MPKGNWIVSLTIENSETYKDYVAGVRPDLERAGGRVRSRGGQHQIREGEGRSCKVLVEFPSHAEAIAGWEAKDYRDLIAIRQRVPVANFTIAEGL